MKLLVTGRGNSGSWQIRGEQLGQAMGATVKQGVTVEDCKAADMVVTVKRVRDDFLQAVRKADVLWVFDALDFYPQPLCSTWTQAQSIHWVKTLVKKYHPSAVIWPNERMRQDCDDGRPGMVLYHHHRPGIAQNPIRKDIKAIGYEGSASYLGSWRQAIERQCQDRGWRFVVNPDHLADVDIVLAIRAHEFAGYAQRHWKSNVKLANAHGSGTPFIGQKECGYLETATGCEYWTEDPGSMKVCFDWLNSQEARELVSDRFIAKAYTFHQAAKDLQTFLHGL